MKKKNLKSLKLNKQSISNLEVEKTKGGMSGIVCALFSVEELYGIRCDSENGCSNTGTDETITCPDYSCACNQK